MAAFEHVRGMTVVQSADLADITHPVNLPYPNGIGKTQGLVVINDNGTTFQLVMAQGAAANAVWSPVDVRTELADVADITPA